MTQLKYSVPSVGEKNTVAEPKVDTALSEIKTVVNGELNSENLAAGGIEESKLSAALQTKLGSFVGLPLEAKKSVIATEQERESATFGTLSTPDEVEVTLPTNGLIVIRYHATWKSSVAEAARVAIFIGANQLKGAISGSPTVVETTLSGANANRFVVLNSQQAGLASGSTENPEYTGDVATGQALGTEPCEVFGLVAGTYKISIRFKASSGKVTVKNRKLWVWVIG